MPARKTIEILTVFSLIFVLSFPALATVYKRGGLTCTNFEKAEEAYKADSGVVKLYNYARCLVAKGDFEQGMPHMHYLSEEKEIVIASYFVARFLQTDGEFKGEAWVHLDEAIGAYSRTLLQINMDETYPLDYLNVELSSNLELYSYYEIPGLYLAKFSAGVVGMANRYEMAAPRHADKEQNWLNTYPKYVDYTVDSLEKMIESAERCLSVPYKDYFHPERYDLAREICQNYKTLAEEFLPLERERLRLLSQESCTRDIYECSEHQVLRSRIGDIWEEGIEKFLELHDKSESIEHGF